jgi:type IV secretion system protein VirB10
VLSPKSNPDNVYVAKVTTVNPAQKQENNNPAYAIPTIPEIPAIPTMPEISQPKAPELKPDPVSLPVAPVEMPTASGQNDQNAQAAIDKKRKASIMLVNNPQSKEALTPEQVDQSNAFKLRSDLKYLLTKGKIIEVILETAINTDQPSEIIGIVSRDVFAEDGETRLIPKGSKAFGSFKTTVDAVYGIISIDWNRIDLATGYSLMLSGSSVDNLGRSGIAGRLDNKYKETVTSNLMSSAINIALAQAQDKLIKPGLNTAQSTANQLLIQNLQASISGSSKVPTTSADPNNPAPNSIYQYCTKAAGYFTDKTMPAFTALNTVCMNNINPTPDQAGADPATYTNALSNVVAGISAALTTVTTNNAANSSTNFTAAQTAVQTAVKDIGSTVQNILTSTKYQPNITVNQGELIRIYVNKDYSFPKQAVDNINIIQ